MDLRNSHSSQDRRGDRRNCNLHPSGRASDRMGVVQNCARPGMDQLQDPAEPYLFRVLAAHRLAVALVYEGSPVLEKR